MDECQEGVGVLEKALLNERELQTLKLNYSMLQEFTDGLKKQLEEANQSLQESRREFFEVKQSKFIFLFKFDCYIFFSQ